MTLRVVGTTARSELLGAGVNGLCCTTGEQVEAQRCCGEALEWGRDAALC